MFNRLARSSCEVTTLKYFIWAVFEVTTHRLNLPDVMVTTVRLKRKQALYNYSSVNSHAQKATPRIIYLF